MAALAPAGIRLIAQSGADLGARMAHLSARLLADGARGGAPDWQRPATLPPAHLAEAARALVAGTADVVLGPAEDGGYYLIGLARPAPALFQDIAWSTGAVLEATRARARALGLREHLLPTWYDVDTPADLGRLRRDLVRPGPTRGARGAGSPRSPTLLGAAAGQQGEEPAHRLTLRARAGGLRRVPGALLAQRAARLPAVPGPGGAPPIP